MKSTFGRVTVTLSLGLLQNLDQREQLHRSLQNPHPESVALADEGFDAWAAALQEERGESLYDARAAKPVRWVEGQGWLEE